MQRGKHANMNNNWNMYGEMCESTFNIECLHLRHTNITSGWKYRP